MSRKTNDLDQALAEVPAAREQIGRWEADLESKRVALADLEGRAGAEALAGGPDVAGRFARDIAGLRAGVDVAASALVAARHRLEEVQRAALAARAGQLRAEARVLREEVAARQITTDHLLGELSRWEEGATYLPQEPWMAEMRPLPDGGTITVPKTRRLLNSAAELEERAAVYDRRAADGPQVSLAGWVENLVAEAAEAAGAPVAA